jgi:hypothetical protein
VGRCGFRASGFGQALSGMRERLGKLDHGRVRRE